MAHEGREKRAGSHGLWFEGRLVLTSAVAVLVFGVAVSVAVRRSIEDLTLVFVHSGRQIVPEGLDAQVKIMRRVVPTGSTIFYILDKPEAWQLGLWQRSLYPDYVVLPIQGLAQLETAEAHRLREANRIEYAISAGQPPVNPAFQWQLVLPLYPNAVPTILGKLAPE